MAELNCSAFKRNPNGSWTCINPVAITNPKGGTIKITPGITLFRGVLIKGVDIVRWLEENCWRKPKLQ